MRKRATCLRLLHVKPIIKSIIGLRVCLAEEYIEIIILEQISIGLLAPVHLSLSDGHGTGALYIYETGLAGNVFLDKIKSTHFKLTH